MNNIMLDLETMGTGLDAAIIAVGAVRFDTDITARFYKIVSLKSSVDAGLRMDPETVLWWMRRSEEARAEFDEEATTLFDCLMSFSEWIGKDAIVWGNGVDFDNVILANAYKALKIRAPWDFWNNRCYRTLKALHPEIELERTGTYHRAVDDAESQAQHLIRILTSSRSDQVSG